MRTPAIAAWSSGTHPGWCLPNQRPTQRCHRLGRGGHLSPVAVAGHPASGELRMQLARMQGQHAEQTIVVVEATADGQSAVLWLTAIEWLELVRTMHRLLARDNETVA